MILLKFLLLVVIANGAPILAQKVFQNRFNQPLDHSIRFFDGRPLLGHSKTYRGVLASIVMTSIAAAILHIPLITGGLFALFAMFGDMLSSFIKRRLGIETSEMALGIDQVPEALIPLLVLRSELQLDLLEVLIIVVAFFLLGLPISRVLYKLRIRQTPH